MDLQETGIAVIVQRMVPAEVAGVLFTTDPVTGNSQHIVVEAAPGIGADLASGTVTPAQFVIDKRDYRIVSSAHTTTIPLTFCQAATWTPLIELAIQVEATFQEPQDIEWAFQDGQFWLLQTRPITTQPAHPTVSNLTRANIGEVLPGIVTPLTWSTFIHVLQLRENGEQSPRPSEMITLVDGRAHMDVQRLWDSYSHILGVHPATVLSNGVGCDIQGREKELVAASEPVGIVTTVQKTAYVWIEMLTLLVQRPRLRHKLYHRLKPELDKIGEEEWTDTDDRVTWRTLQHLFELTGLAFVLHMQASFLALCSYATTRDLLAGIVGTKEADRVVSMTAHSLENAGGLRKELQMMADHVHERPELARLFLDSPRETLLETLSNDPAGRLFLDRMTERVRQLGDRAVQEFELNAKRWSEDPRPLLVALQATIRDRTDPPHTSTLPEAREPPSVDVLLERIALPKRWLLRRVHHAFLTYSKLREETKSALTRCFSEMRRLYTLLGTGLQATGVLEREEHVFFLSIDEIQEWMVAGTMGQDYRERVRRRRKAYEQSRGRAKANRDAAEASPVLSGTAISDGCITGRACIVSDPALASLQRGEILVTEHTDPGWLPLFLIAGAIVTEIGGMLSHTATLARELHKPAVFSVADATRLIHHGQLITVDGARGLVYLSQEATD
jgi:pyruvate,water dikinase